MGRLSLHLRLKTILSHWGPSLVHASDMCSCMSGTLEKAGVFLHALPGANTAAAHDSDISRAVQDGALLTSDNMQHHSLHEEQTAEKAVSHSSPSIVQDVGKREAGLEADDHNATIQSPASTLADTLSLLSLSTPAAVDYKSSRLGQNGQQKGDDGHHTSCQTADSQSKEASDQNDASRIAVRKPAKAQEGDVSVGLVYDAIMEEHGGPPGDIFQSKVALSDLQCHLLLYA